jgi:outer membrane protein insertion porin family
MKKQLFFFFSFLLSILSSSIVAQISLGQDLSDINYNSPKEYEIAAVTFQTKDNSNLDQSILKLLTGFEVGQKIQVPGDQISSAIEALWKQGLFTGIGVHAPYSNLGIDLLPFAKDKLETFIQIDTIKKNDKPSQ